MVFCLAIHGKIYLIRILFLYQHTIMIDCNKYFAAVDQSSSGNRGEYYQVAPGIVVETFNMPGQGDRVLPDLNRVRLCFIRVLDITLSQYILSGCHILPASLWIYFFCSYVDHICCSWFYGHN